MSNNKKCSITVAGMCQTEQTPRKFLLNSKKAIYELISQHMSKACKAQHSFCCIIGVPLAEQTACQISTQNVNSGMVIL